MRVDIRAMYIASIKRTKNSPNVHLNHPGLSPIVGAELEVKRNDVKMHKTT